MSTASGGSAAIAHMMPWGGIGGVEIATLRLVEATRDRFRHVAFCLPAADELATRFGRMGVEVVRFDEPVPSLLHASHFLQQSQVLARQLRAAGAGLVHFAEVRAAEHTSLAARLAGARLLCHVRVSHPVLKLRDRLPVMLVERFLFVSEEARSTFALPLPPRRAGVLYDAVAMPQVDTARLGATARAELGIAAGTPVVGMVARISPQKDYFTLAQAAVQVLAARPDALFLLVGDHSDVALNREHFQAVQARLVELGIADRFLFTGHRTDVQALTCAMDFCVLPTHREGLPLSILETMSLGKAVVATAVGGVPEVVLPGLTGLLHAHGDSAGLAHAVLELIDHPAEAKRLGTQAAAMIADKFSPESYRQAITGIYEDMLPATRQRR